MSHRVRKPLALLTSAALMSSLWLGAGAPSASAEEALLKITYPDVAENHWARVHVAKLSSAGIIRGYSDGTFQPSRPVSQQEAIVMALRMMGHYDDELPNPDNVAIGLEVDSFFTKFVIKAISERIINLGEETAAAAQGDEPWGKRAATREWISKLIVRSLGEQPATGALPFADASQITESAAGYVLKSQQLGLVQGYTDNTFRPGNAVTRAELVTILSRADEYFEDDEERYASGFITNRTSDSITIRSEQGDEASFAINSETVVFGEDDQPVPREQLASGMKVRIIHFGGHAYYIETSGESAGFETFEGELKAHDVGLGSIVVRDSAGTMHPYQLAATATVTDEAGNKLSLDQLTEGSIVRLERMRGTEEITSVILVEAAFNDEGTGIVQAVNLEKRTLSFTNSSGTVVTYPIDPEASLTVKGQPLENLSGLQEGDTFEYVVRNSVIVAVNVTVQKHILVTGEYQYAQNGIITIKVSATEPQAYTLAASPTVVIEGLSNTTLDDLQTGDTVQLRIQGATNRVDRITVTNRNVSVLKSVTFREIEDDFVLVRDSAGKTQFFRITDRTQFMLDGAALAKELRSAYLTNGRKVTLHVTNDQLVRLEIVTKVSGTIVSLDAAARSVTVRTEQNEEVKLPLASYVGVEAAQQTNATLADAVPGTKVQLLLGNTTDEVTSILIEKSLVYTLSSVTLSPRTVYAKPALGSIQSFYLDTDVRVLDAKGSAIELSALALNQPILLNYAGRKLVSVQQASTTIGVVTLLDTTGGRLTVTDFNKNAKNFSLTGGITVLKGASVSTQPSALKLNDRVVLVVDSQGKPHVQVAQMEVRKFSAYDASKHEITLKIAKIGDQSKYILDPDVHVHAEDGSALALNRLRENDELTIYILDGKILEIIK